MMFFLACALIAAGLIGLHLSMPRHPRVYCALYGHDPKLGDVKIASDLHWRCSHCGKEMVL